MKKPNVKDFDLQPYGYIHALQAYIEFLENKEIYLNRLKEQYKEIFKFENWSEYKRERQNDYQAMRLFCLDTQLISFNDIEMLEFEVNQSFL